MKNAAVVASLTCLAIGAWLLLPKGPWMNACPAILALAGVVLLQGETWRRTALVSAAVAASAFGLDMHNMWSPANLVPILVLDVYEHAYMIDYGIDRGKYLDAFMSNLDWDVVAKRLSYSHKHPSGTESTL